MLLSSHTEGEWWHIVSPTWATGYRSGSAGKLAARVVGSGRRHPLGEVCVLKCVGTQVPCRVGVLVAAAAPEAVTAVANRLDPATGQKPAQRRKNNHGSSCDGELLSDNDQHATTSTTIKNQHSREGACQLCLPVSV